MIAAEWIRAELPPLWGLARVRDHVTVLNGYPFDSELFSAEIGLPLVRIRDISNDDTEVRYAGELVSEALICDGDILIGMDGDFNVAKWRGGQALLNQRVCCVRPRSTVDPGFLYYVLPAPLKLINEFTYSTTVKHLSSFDVLKIHFPFPPLLQQRAIADHLDGETARLDALVAAKERVLGLLAEKRRALITRAVTRGLDPSASLRESGIPWLGKIPQHWRPTRLKFVAVVRGGVALGKNYGAAALVELPYLRVANVQDGHLDLSDVASVMVPPAEAATCTLEIGDVLMNEGGDADKLGRGCVWHGEISPCLHQNHVFAVRPTNVRSDWLNLWTSTEGAKAFFESRAKQSTNLASISAANIGELPIPLPPAAEQRAILDHLNGQNAKLNAMYSATERTIALLKERRAALIAAAVTGHIDVGSAGYYTDDAASHTEAPRRQ